ncbi:head-tail connector protein [Salimicrobium album]|uniref:Phage gp6-like head-tail connector protein n=1 Tax=Salimicrobium album TaxID=50717 RepID=A0A1H3D814_9BACI|nr:hypothetical protein [Salimicrobium album]SDX62662.1 hypothetical protein SAMN04488081_0869 [Salimicrobium album]
MEEQELVGAVMKRMQSNTKKHGDYIQTMVPDFLEIAEQQTNNSFHATMPRSVIQFIAGAIDHKLTVTPGVKSRSMGDVSYSYQTEYPKSLDKLLRPYKRVKLHG